MKRRILKLAEPRTQALRVEVLSYRGELECPKCHRKVIFRYMPHDAYWHEVDDRIQCEHCHLDEFGQT